MTQEEICARKQQYHRSLVVLNGNRERDRLFFWITLGIGGLLLLIMTAVARNPLFGGFVFALVFALLGIPGLIGWRKAEAKIVEVQTQLHRLECCAAQPKHTSAGVPGNTTYCMGCGAERSGAEAFCPACGTKQ